MLERIGPRKLLVPRRKNPGMLVDGVIYADEYIEKFLDARSVEQVKNAACLPGIVSRVAAMPDIHAGYGFPIGGVAAFDADEGVISPGGVGYDINCGVRLIGTGLHFSETEKLKEKILENFFRDIPCGLGKPGKLRLSKSDLRSLVEKGAGWSVEKGYGDAGDLEKTESRGRMEGADPEAVSGRAYERGLEQEGTLGSGNHFLELQRVDEIYDEKKSAVFGLEKGGVAIMLHSGSRGFGHQICSDFLPVMRGACVKYGISVPDRQLSAAPFRSPEGQKYFSAMKAAANYAWANRQILGHLAVMSLKKSVGKNFPFSLVYDIAHNIAKLENHDTGEGPRELIVHRKGATRAFGPGNPELPEIYRDTGQPVIIPGDMGRFSYILAGSEKAMRETFGSACHGAGRIMSRGEARRRAAAGNVLREMAGKGILVRAENRSILSEEMSGAYKNAENVVNVVHEEGLAVKVARLRPLLVIKG